MFLSIIYYIRSFTIGNHDECTLGQFQDDQFQGHEHDLLKYKEYGGASSGNTVWRWDSESCTRGITSKEGYGTVRYGTTTHGKQVGVNYLIKAL